MVQHMKMISLTELPEDCISIILSFSSAQDVCRSAVTCSELRLAAQSDFVWESFLPVDVHEIVSRADPFLLHNYGSKRELFFLLCNSLLIDFGHKMFSLDRITGLKSYVLSARDLSIAWANDPIYWSWKRFPKSRFNESVELRTTSWLEIHGTIKLKLLSKNTTYGAYLIFNVSERAYGLDIMPMETSIQKGNHLVSKNTVYLRQDDHGIKNQIQWLLYYNRTEMLASRVDQGLDESDHVLLGVRNDEWMEIELGQFFCDDDDDDDDEKVVKMSLMEIKGHHLKGGLVIEGIEIRPLH